MGCGLVGAAIVRDLAAEPDYAVSALDADPTRVADLSAQGIDCRRADLTDAAKVRDEATAADLVVGALPGRLGARAVAAALEAGRPVVDISFFPEDPAALDRVARSADVPCLIDCGVAPGLSNLILGREEASLDLVNSFRCLVGGLPVVREPPWEYKAPFSPADVIEEYIRPARLRRDGSTITLPAISELELVELPGVGQLEAFNTDGLRSLLNTSRARDLSEKTLRYPGHAAKIVALRDAGMFSEEPVRVSGGDEVVPRRVTERLLFDAWRYAEGEADLTVMRVEVEGERDGQAVRRTHDLIDHFDRLTGVSSMARTTGYTCTAMVKLVATGDWREAGVAAPEAVGRDPACYQAIMEHLAARSVTLSVAESPISA